MPSHLARNNFLFKLTLQTTSKPQSKNGKGTNVISKPLLTTNNVERIKLFNQNSLAEQIKNKTTLLAVLQETWAEDERMEGKGSYTYTWPNKLQLRDCARPREDH